MSRTARRHRLQLVVDDRAQFKLCFALRYHAHRLLVDSNVALLPGETVTVTPLCDHDALDLRQFEALVVHHYEDQAPGRPGQRHMASLLIDAPPHIHAALRDAIDQASLHSLRRGPTEQTHGPELLNAARWA